MINSLRIKEINLNDLLKMKKTHNILLQDNELIFFINRISERKESVDQIDSNSVYSINYDLFHKSYNRLSQQLKLTIPAELKPEVPLEEKEIIDFITEIESNDEDILVSKNIIRDIYKSFEVFVTNCVEFTGHKSVDEPINLEIDDIKAKLKEIEVIINEFSTKSGEKYQKLILLKDYIQKLENNIKYYEESFNNVDTLELEMKKSSRVETIEEYNKLLDENHNMNNILVGVKMENHDLHNMYYKKEKEVDELKVENKNYIYKINELKTELENIYKLNEDYKIEIDNLTDQLNLKGYKIDGENELRLSDGDKGSRNVRLFSNDDDFNMVNPSPNLGLNQPFQEKTSFNEIIQVMNGTENLENDPLFINLNEDQKKYFLGLESAHKALIDKVAILEKNQSLYEQKIFVFYNPHLACKYFLTRFLIH